jgi:hypothetical protein
MASLPTFLTLPTLKGPKGRGTPTAKDLRAERKIEWIERMERVEGMERIDAIEGIEDKYNREDGCYI